MRETPFFAMLIALLLTSVAHAQAPVFRAESNAPEVRVGQPFEVGFVLENAKGTDFTPPEWTHFDLLGGPNVSSQFQMMNGTVSQQLRYGYYLQAREEGTFFIGPASVEVAGKLLESAPLEIVVFANPDGTTPPPRYAPTQPEQRHKEVRKQRKRYRL